MKKLIILSLLVLNSCTTIRRDDHSYTYIHNFNSTSEEKPSRQYKSRRDNDVYPFYEKNGLSQNSAVIDNDPNDFNDINDLNDLNDNNIHNNYQQSHRVAAYNPPNSYSGFSPSARRYLIYGEVR